jgi:pimeloyl-ACP methyl ester carboxylesterase
MTMSQTFQNAATRTIQVKDTRMVYRELGERGGVPVIFLHHLTAVLDDWDPKVLDGIAGSRHVVIFDNRGVGGSGGQTPVSVADRRRTRSRSSRPLASRRSTFSASRWAASSRR